MKILLLLLSNVIFTKDQIKYRIIDSSYIIKNKNKKTIEINESDTMDLSSLKCLLFSYLLSNLLKLPTGFNANEYATVEQINNRIFVLTQQSKSFFQFKDINISYNLIHITEDCYKIEYIIEYGNLIDCKDIILIGFEEFDKENVYKILIQTPALFSANFKANDNVCNANLELRKFFNNQGYYDYSFESIVKEQENDQILILTFKGLKKFELDAIKIDAKEECEDIKKEILKYDKSKFTFEDFENQLKTIKEKYNKYAFKVQYQKEKEKVNIDLNIKLKQKKTLIISRVKIANNSNNSHYSIMQYLQKYHVGHYMCEADCDQIIKTLMKSGCFDDVNASVNNNEDRYELTICVKEKQSGAVLDAKELVKSFMTNDGSEFKDQKITNDDSKDEKNFLSTITDASIPLGYSKYVNMRSVSFAYQYSLNNKSIAFQMPLSSFMNITLRFANSTNALGLAFTYFPLFKITTECSMPTSHNILSDAKFNDWLCVKNTLSGSAVHERKINKHSVIKNTTSYKLIYSFLKTDPKSVKIFDLDYVLEYNYKANMIPKKITFKTKSSYLIDGKTSGFKVIDNLELIDKAEYRCRMYNSLTYSTRMPGYYKSIINSLFSLNISFVFITFLNNSFDCNSMYKIDLFLQIKIFQNYGLNLNFSVPLSKLFNAHHFKQEGAFSISIAQFKF